MHMIRFAFSFKSPNPQARAAHRAAATRQTNRITRSLAWFFDMIHPLQKGAPFIRDDGRIMTMFQFAHRVCKNKHMLLVLFRSAPPFQPTPASYRRLVGAAAALAGLLAFITATAAFAIEDCPAEDGESAHVTSVIDGATLALDSGLVVRLAGITAPDPPLALADGRWPLAQTARAALTRLADGALVDLVYVADRRDRYGRAVAVVAIDGGEPSLADAMLAQGLARVTPDGEPEACLVPLFATEREAREKRLGLWADPYYAIRAASDPSLVERSDAYDLVEGRVLSVGQRGRIAYLDFGDDWRTDFTAIVTGAAADALTAKGWALNDLVGRKVRLRGWIEDHDGPSVRASQPGQIEVLGDGD